MLWKPDEHSLEENLRWALLRAMEWLTWPNFISQPIVPILLYFYPWPWVIGSVVLISFPWRMVVAPVVVSPTLADAGVWFVKSRWVTSPIMAFLIWQTTDDYLTAPLALFWPLVGAAIVIYAVGLLRMPLSLIFPAGGERRNSAQFSANLWPPSVTLEKGEESGATYCIETGCQSR